MTTPMTRGTYNIIVSRLQRLEDLVYSLFPDAPSEPFAVDDAAALIVLPRSDALRLARKLFGGGQGIARDLQANDISFNMDWFRPRDEHGRAFAGSFGALAGFLR